MELPKAKDMMEKLERVQERVTKINEGLVHRMCKEIERMFFVLSRKENRRITMNLSNLKG